MINDIILVDENDAETGTAEKLKAHQEGLLHRAFSLFIYQDNKLLLQKRQSHKYHSAGLWTNTCCSHPFPGETIKAAAVRRVKEELGIILQLEEISALDVFHYTARVGNQLIENEIDHVLLAKMPGTLSFAKIKIDFNPDEISAIKWMTLMELKQDLSNNPLRYTAWLPQVLAIVEASRIVQ